MSMETFKRVRYMRMRMISKPERHTYPSDPGNDSRGKPRLFSGCRVGLLVGASLASIIFVVNLSVIAWASTMKGSSVYSANCDKVKKVNTVIHLAINILSTLLLGASNYCMQCICAPTREEVDRAHARLAWADIGVQSIRNLKLIKRWKVIAWVLLALSSLPLHLVYNSVFSASISNNAYDVILVDGTLPSISQLPTNSSVAGTNRLAQVLKDASSMPLDFETLSNAECIDAYTHDFLADRSNLILMSGGRRLFQIPENFTGNPSTFREIPHVERVWSVQASAASTGAGAHAYEWIGDGYKISEVKRYVDQWNMTIDNCTTTRTTDNYGESRLTKCYVFVISECLSQKVEPRCRINFSLPLGAIVVIFNFIKALNIILVLVMFKGRPLVTVGDAIGSFMHSPDWNTRSWCLASAEDVQKTWGLCGAHLNRRKSSPQPFQAKQGHYVSGAGARIWMMWIGLFVVAIIGTSVCAGFAFRQIIRVGGSPLVGIGEVNVYNMITGWNVSGWGITVAVLIANAPQTVLSFLYLVHNNMCTRMLLAAEWSDFANERKGLRMSERAAIPSAQRSTYFLQIPYRYGVPLMLLSVLMHWLVSQSIYLAVIDAYDSGGHPEPDMNYVTCGYSPIAMLFTAVTGLILMFGTIYFALVKKLSSGIPVAGSNSAAIAAACHPPKDGGNEKEPVMWGAIPEVQLSPNGRDFIGENSNVGHCSFSSGAVESPTQWRPYA